MVKIGNFRGGIMKKRIVVSALLIVILGIFAFSKSQDQKEKKEEIEPLETEQKAKQLLQDTIKYHQLFNKKMASPDFSDFIAGKFEIWKRESKIKVPKDVKWPKFKSEMAQLGSQLAILKDNSSYITLLRKDPSVYNALKSFLTSLSAISGLPDVVRRKAYIPLLNAYVHQLYTNKLLEKINEIIKKTISLEKEPAERIDSDQPYIGEGYEDIAYQEYQPSETFEEFKDFGDLDFDFDFDF